MKKSHQIAIAIVLIMTIWMALGQFKDSPKSETKADSINSLFLVEVIDSKVQSMPLVIQAVGDVRPLKNTKLRAEVAGQVEHLTVQDGQLVKSGELLLSLAKNDKQVQLEKNQSLLKFHTSRYQRSKKLEKKQFQSELETEEAYAAMKGAEAALKKSQLDLANTQISAPFTGIFESRQVDVGDYLAVKDEIGYLIDNSQLIITVPIAQNVINQVKLGNKAQVQFATGETRVGVVTFKSAMAKAETRTFDVEIKIDNADLSILAGSSADVNLMVAEREAHYVSPAILVLNDAGEIGIKSVNADNTVHFHQVSIINSDPQGVWLAGLPDALQIISVGQAYAKSGVTVRTQVKNEVKNQSQPTPNKVRQ